MSAPTRLAVIGLGYVGLPLAIQLARHYAVVGFDVDAERVRELGAGRDRTHEIPADVLNATSLRVTGEAAAIADADIYIVATPTPVDADNKPDLSAVRGACRTVGAAMGKGAIVVFESTVYPGVTEDICGPELAAASGLVCGTDFFLGYSPERINPGDREHTVEQITKVVAGQTPAVAQTLADLYGTVTSGGVFLAKDIKTAEAAKVIENAQRDINIAFINEVTMIFEGLGISIYDVLAASATKWNFLDFRPGLVGGHCIGVDPYYLAHAGQEIGYNPEIILAGRRINDGMGAYIAGRIHETLSAGSSGNTMPANPRTLVLGLTFKENVPDLRNSRVVDVITQLRALGHTVDVHDPHANADEARQFYDIDLLPAFTECTGYDCVVGAVTHTPYGALDASALGAMLRDGGLVADIKGMWRHLDLPTGIRRWQL